MNSLEFAFKMERDGEKYYKDQAERNKDNRLHSLFLMLAKDEENHAKIFQDRFNDSAYTLADDDTLSKSKNIFKEAENFKSEIREIPKQLEIYHEALNMEKQSIDLYTKLLSEATDDQEKRLFEYLIRQEKEHFEIIED